MGYELAGAKIVGLNLDEGEENIREVKLLWLENDLVNNMT